MEKKNHLDNKSKTKCKVCGGNVMKGTSFCWFHNPQISEQERNKYRSKGGRKKITALIPVNDLKVEEIKSFKKFKLDTIPDITNFMRGVLTLAGNGLISSKDAKSYFQLSEKLINAIMTEKKYKHII